MLCLCSPKSPVVAELGHAVLLRADTQREGVHHDLQEALEAFNHVQFDGHLDGVRVAWSAPEPTMAVLGLCWDSSRPVVLHVGMDAASVPQYVVHSVLFHELCHLVVPSEDYCDGTLEHHPRAFWLMHERYPHHTRAEQWLAKNQTRLRNRMRRICGTVK